MAADKKFIPYGRQTIEQDDIDAVVEVLQSDWLTTGPTVARFEEAVAGFVDASYAVAVCNGTAALHAAMFAIGIGPGDEVIVPPLTFVATANAVLYQGGKPVFTDIDIDDLLLDPTQLEDRITPRTKAVVAVDYAGQPCDYDALKDICRRRNLRLIVDACHSFGGTYKNSPVGHHADLTVFSFHPVKPMTTGEGGLIVTDDPSFAERLRCFRNHGITTDHFQRSRQNSWQYQMVELGYNYRLTDIQSALGLSQLKKIERWIRRRRELAELYQRNLRECSWIKPLKQHADRQSGWHLFVVRVLNGQRDALFGHLRSEGIGVNVHYGLVYNHPYYQQIMSEKPSCPVADQVESEIITLPLYPGMSDRDVDCVSLVLTESFS